MIIYVADSDIQELDLQCTYCIPNLRKDASCILQNGTYKYTECRPASPISLPPQCLKVTTPLIVQYWSLALQQHPDREFVSYILEGLAYGFHVGLDPGDRSYSCKDNMQSAYDNPKPVDDYLAVELAAGRIVGPFDPNELCNVHISRFGVIPKPNQFGKWRLILDLSSPKEASVTDGISKALCSMSYISTDDAVEKILQLGDECLLAKVTVHPDDRPVLAMSWRGKLYVDTVLPFGLRSAPKIFTAVADALEWIFRARGVSIVLHYLDDFLTMGRATSDECKRNLELIEKTWEYH